MEGSNIQDEGGEAKKTEFQGKRFVLGEAMLNQKQF
jgi:hypothetical protein